MLLVWIDTFKVKFRDFLDNYLSLNPEAKVITLHSLLWGIVIGLFYMSVLQLYLKSAGYSGGGVGLFMLINGVTMVIFTIPAGRIADTFGRRKLAIISALLVFIAAFLMVISTLESFIFTSAFLGGLGLAFRYPSVDALLADKARDNVEAAYSLSSFLRAVGFALGGVMGWIPELLVVSRGVTYFEAYRLTVFFTCLTVLISIIPLTSVSESEFHSGNGKITRIRTNKLLLKLFTLNAMVGFGAGFSIPLITYYLSLKFHVESGPIGTLNAATSILGSLSYLAAPTLIKTLGFLQAMLFPQAIATALLALVPFSSSFTLASSILIPRTVLMNIINPLWESLFVKSCLKEDRATVLSISTLSWSLPNSISVQIGGIIMDYSLDTPIFITSFIYAIYLVSTFTLLRRERL